MADYLGQAGYVSVQTGKWHLGDRPEYYPAAVGFDGMYHMLPYFADACTWIDPKIFPDFPLKDPSFMKWFSRLYNDGEWEGVKVQPAKKTRVFTREDLAVVDNRMAETVSRWIKDHSKDSKPLGHVCPKRSMSLFDGFDSLQA